jgi:uncharacterized protein (TIGR03663 family)
MTGPKATPNPQASAPDAPPPTWRYWAYAAALLLAGLILRLEAVGLRPYHHDEGVNGFFLTRLVRNGVYQYDPSNYHGPTLYYFSLAASRLAGLGLASTRGVTLAFGMATLALVLGLRRALGSSGTLTALALLAFSPGAVFFSNYYIHEILLVFFSLAFLIALIELAREWHPGWLLIASASASLAFATKETAVLTAAVFALAAVGTEGHLWLLARMGRPKAPPLTQLAVSRRALWVWAGVAAALFVLIAVLLFSSFFTYWRGAKGALETLAIWSRTGQSAHRHPWHTYVSWLWRAEAPALLCGALGIVVALWRGRDRVSVFLAFWALGVGAAYSLIPYKTPWLALNLVLPLALVAGCAARAFWTGPWRIAVVAVAVAGAGYSGQRAYQLNYLHYDDDRQVYVYAHTRRSFNDLIARIEELAARSGAGKEAGIRIMSPDYWPMPWNLRDYPRAGFYGSLVDAEDSVVVVASPSQEKELAPRLGTPFVRDREFTLRPGVELVLYVRRALADPTPPDRADPAPGQGLRLRVGGSPVSPP